MPFITQGKANIKYLLIVVLVAAVAGGIIFSVWNSYQKEIVSLDKAAETNDQRQVVCTQEAKICPDGSSVVRTGPNCEFSECSGAIKINVYNLVYCIGHNDTVSKIEVINGKVVEPERTGPLAIEAYDYKCYLLDTDNLSKKELTSSELNSLTIASTSENFPDGLRIIKEVSDASQGGAPGGLILYTVFLSKDSNKSLIENEESPVRVFKLIGWVMSPQDNTAKDETAGWKTYRNEEYGFEIKYPKDWTYEQNIFSSKPNLVFCPINLTEVRDGGTICKLKTGAPKPQYEEGMIYLFSYGASNLPTSPPYNYLGLDSKSNHYYLFSELSANKNTADQMISTFNFTETSTEETVAMRVIYYLKDSFDIANKTFSMVEAKGKTVKNENVIKVIVNDETKFYYNGDGATKYITFSEFVNGRKNSCEGDYCSGGLYETIIGSLSGENSIKASEIFWGVQ